MSAFWGAVPLNISRVSFMAPELLRVEKKLIPAKESTQPQSVLMGSGRMRKQFELVGWVSLAEETLLMSDYYSSEKRQLSIPDVVTLEGYITSYQSSSQPGTKRLNYTLTIIEA